MSDSDPIDRRSSGINNLAFRWAFFAALVVVAVVYFVMPARAAEPCGAWVAEMWEDEGGELLTAANCATGSPDRWLILNCAEGTVWVRYDLAFGAERSPDMGESRDVVFAAGDSRVTLAMHHQEMDGFFAGDAPADGDLTALIRAGGDLSISDADQFYPLGAVSLEGAPAALEVLLGGC